MCFAHIREQGERGTHREHAPIDRSRYVCSVCDLSPVSNVRHVTDFMISPCASWAPPLFGSMCGRSQWLFPHRTTMTQTKCCSIFHCGCGCQGTWRVLSALLFNRLNINGSLDFQTGVLLRHFRPSVRHPRQNRASPRATSQGKNVQLQQGSGGQGKTPRALPWAVPLLSNTAQDTMAADDGHDADHVHLVLLSLTADKLQLEFCLPLNFSGMFSSLVLFLNLSNFSWDFVVFEALCELIHTQGGQCGNQIGATLRRVLSVERSIDSTGT